MIEDLKQRINYYESKMKDMTPRNSRPSPSTIKFPNVLDSANVGQL